MVQRQKRRGTFFMWCISVFGSLIWEVPLHSDTDLVSKLIADHSLGSISDIRFSISNW